MIGVPGILHTVRIYVRSFSISALQQEVYKICKWKFWGRFWEYGKFIAPQAIFCKMRCQMWKNSTKKEGKVDQKKDKRRFWEYGIFIAPQAIYCKMRCQMWKSLTKKRREGWPKEDFENMVNS